MGFQRKLPKRSMITSTKGAETRVFRALGVKRLASDVSMKAKLTAERTAMAFSTGEPATKSGL